MATIKTRRRANGTTRFTAYIRLRKGKEVIYQESKTFSHVGAAKTWARHREVQLEDPDTLKEAQEGAKPRGAESYKLKKIIRWYIDSFKAVANWGRTKQTTLEFLERHPVGDEDARELTCQKLIDHIRGRRDGGAGPATVANDLVWIGVALRAAKTAGGMRVNPQVVEEAQIGCRELRLTGRPKRRERRPSGDEKVRLHDYFTRPGRRSGMPMADLVDFAFESGKRVAEICRILWSDNDSVKRTGLVRDAKHPTEKEGNHKRFKYTPEAWEIVQRQPRTDDRIFPYNARSVGELFRRACKVLEIDDLHFHDSRHEATSQLFERGYQIHEVALITNHESWDTLKRYANLRPENLREIKAPHSNSNASRRRPQPATPFRPPSGAADRSVPRDRPRSPATATSARRA